MSNAFRLGQGGRIDRTAPLEFRFNNRTYGGFRGDTLASALLANGVHFVARSWKYHRRRGIFSAGAEEPNAIVRVLRDAARDVPNLRATQVELYSGLEACSQSCWPSLEFDVAALAGMFSPLLGAGFYYKTFMGPRWMDATRTWSTFFEPVIRHAAGQGRAPAGPDPDTYLNRYAHCDVLVIGAGPAGIAAAGAAAAAGASVILCDEQAEPGGSLLGEAHAQIDGRSAVEWCAQELAALARLGVRVLPRTTAFGYYAANFVALAERLSDHLPGVAPGTPRERLWQVRAQEVVIATGAIERPLVFNNNDRPGIMLADAARTYLNRYGVIPGRRAVVATACDSAYRAALDLAAAGVEIAAICDVRAAPSAEVMDAAAQAGLRVLTATSVADTRGGARIASALVQPLGSAGAARWMPCDLLLTSAGWTPSIHLFAQARGTMVWDPARAAYLPGATPQRQRSAGACRGLLALADVVADGHAAGHAAAGAAGIAIAKRPALVTQGWSYAGNALGPIVAPAAGARFKTFVDLQSDVSYRDLEIAVQEGFRSVEHVKRYTTCGMATDQGKTSNLHALAILSGMTGRDIPEIGLTTYRQPYTPVTFGTLAGHARGLMLDPLRLPPSDPWARAHGALYEEVGQWRRARCFPQPGETAEAALARECAAVRQSAGMLDASTLGKIDVTGPDAREFLSRMYVNDLSTLAPGRCVYAVLLNESGFVIDDGVIACLDEQRFFVTTTTSRAAMVLHLMEDYLQTEWPTLDVWATSVTEQWATVAVQGPRSREALRAVFPDLDTSTAALPHMGLVEAGLGGVPGRVFRVSFTGELGFEVSVPSGYGLALWEELHSAVSALGGCAYGIDAMHVLRAEKGYMLVGQEADGTMVPADLGLNWLVGKSKLDFVGKRSLERPGIRRAGRPQLVGLLSVEPSRLLDVGAQIVPMPKPAAGEPSLGFVSSAYRSVTLGRTFALALLADGRKRIGSRLYVPLDGGPAEVEVVSPVFYDPERKRLND